MIPKDTIDRIFEAARVEEVVGDYVALKKRGANLLGLCPFHNEKSPSFTVSPAKGIYKCFGCGKAGNSVNFIMDHDHLSYPEALRYLAKKYNIEIEEQEQTPEQIIQNNERESLYVVSSFAQKHFTNNLLNTDEGRSVGLSYFKERGFRPDIIEKFQLGYGIDGWRAFTDAAVAQGHKVEYLVKAGLTIEKTRDENPNTGTSNLEPRTSNYFDRFSARVIFPIHNLTGRVIAFGGRTLKTDKKIAKYLNSPETDIYHKSSVLYGAYFAKQSIVREDNCFLVEGYTDVVSLFQAGIENVVAPCGTSLTPEQIRLIRRYTNNITVMFDGDSAGIKASMRGINMILEEGMNVKVLLFPDGEDPDSFSKKNSTDTLKNFIATHTQDFIAFKTQLLMKDAANDPIKKVGLIKDIVESIALIPEAINRSVYIKECSRLMEISEQILITEVGKHRRNKPQGKRDAEPEINNRNVNEILPEGIEPLITEPEPSPETSCEAQEKNIIRLLLVYGSHEIEVNGFDENNQAVTVQMSIADFIVDELAVDNITFETPIYQQLFNVFAQRADASIPDQNFFIKHADQAISNEAINIFSSPYQLSNNWSKHGIDIRTEDMILKRSAYNAIFSLKSKKVELWLAENQKQIKECTSDTELNDLLKKRVELEKLKKGLNGLLGRVVIK